MLGERDASPSCIMPSALHSSQPEALLKMSTVFVIGAVIIIIALLVLIIVIVVMIIVLMTFSLVIFIIRILNALGTASAVGA